MIINTDKKILIVGLGLMGGSYAKALKRFGFHISALSDKQADIDYALKHKIISEGSSEIDAEMISEADIIIFALYPHIFKEWILKNQKFIKPGALLTDVTGVKGCIVYDIQDILHPDVEYIAAHPMAGREVSGVENSTPEMFIGANYIVTPTKKNTPEAIKACIQLGKVLGFHRVRTLSVEEHDEMIAFVSQLTHCIAVSLMTCSDTEGLETFTGDSFRDLTRIANINEIMWTELFLDNREALLHEMNLFEKQFNKLKTVLEQGNAEEMKKIMRKSSERRRKFDKE